MEYKPRYKKGDRIGGRYLVHQALMGGMGEVYLSLDLKRNEPVALKTFQQRFMDNIKLQKLQEAFQVEVAIWIALEKHPNIVRCYLLDNFDNQPFMILDWVASDDNRGTDLRSWLHYGPLNIQLVLDFAVDICHGLIHANQKVPGIVHCDLNPKNILIEQNRIARITDWGLAKIIHDLGVERGDRIHESNQAGTALYMAPEQWFGTPLDVRTDIYAIGCILFEMLTGYPPYIATTIEELRTQHINGPVPSLHQQSDLADLDAMITTCLSKQPGQRFQSVEDLLQELVRSYKTRFSESPRQLMISGGDALTAADYNNRSATYHQLRQYDDALRDCNQAMELDPKLVNTYNTRGHIFLSLKEYNKALQDFDRAIQLDPTFFQAFNNRGLVYRELHQYERALSNLNQAIQLEPNLPQVYCSRGAVYEELQKYDEAWEILTRLFSLTQAQ